MFSNLNTIKIGKKRFYYIFLYLHSHSEEIFSNIVKLSTSDNL